MKGDAIVDMRDAFFDQLYEYISVDKNVVILTADHGAFGLKKIENDYPEQYLNIGIAEQALVSIAAGLAKCGKKVYIYAINNFVSLRVLEQINIDLCAMNLDVNNTKKLVELSYNNSGPKYFRIEKGKLPRIYSSADDISGGQKIINSQDSDYVIISSGYMTQKVNNVVKCLSEQNILLAHMDLFRVSPLPIGDIVSFTKNKNVIIVEDNIKSGGIAEKVFCLLKEYQHTGRVLSISLKNKFYFDFGDRDMLHKIAKIDEDSISEKIKNFIN